jgi:hypothetical protein
MFKYTGTINTFSTGKIQLNGVLPEDLQVEKEVLIEGTVILVENAKGGICRFVGQSAINLLLIELNQYKKPTIH